MPSVDATRSFPSTSRTLIDFVAAGQIDVAGDVFEADLAVGENPQIRLFWDKYLHANALQIVETFAVLRYRRPVLDLDFTSESE